MNDRGKKLSTFVKQIFLAFLVLFGGLRAFDEQAVPAEQDQTDLLVERIIQEIKEKYVFPEIADKLSKRLLNEKKNYHGCSSLSELAGKIESDLFELSRDKHLHVIHRPSHEQTRGQQPAAAGTATENNFGLAAPEILNRHIGYLKINRMAIEREAAAMVGRYLSELSGCKALIIDIRDNQGGAAGMVVFLASYLFPEPTHLYTQYNRLKDEYKEVWTLSDVPGKRPEPNIPIYILIGSRTFSAAEGLAYCLKHHKRAIIVGERSAGGAHPIIWVKLPLDFEISIPFARIIHPVTGGDWEGAGVIPHHQVKADAALQKAISLIADDSA